MAYKILETVIVKSSEIELDNSDFVKYFCKQLGCPWSVNGSKLRQYLKFHKIENGFLVEYGQAKWGNTITQFAGFFQVSEDNNDLISKYF